MLRDHMWPLTPMACPHLTFMVIKWLRSRSSSALSAFTAFNSGTDTRTRFTMVLASGGGRLTLKVHPAPLNPPV